MIIVMKSHSKPEDAKNVCAKLESLGLGVHLSKGKEVTIIGVIGDKRVLAGVPIELMPGVDKTTPITESYKLASKPFHPEPTVVNVDGVKIGGAQLVVMAGPCAIESKDQLLKAADAVKAAGAVILRGGAYKPRTSPYAFQGLEEEGLKYMKEAKKRTNLKIITEVISPESVELAENYVDMLQIGARNMQNFHLLKKVGKSKKPVLLKRGLSATIDEWINAAEYIMSEGNYNVVLCERGIRTYETATRNTLDLSAVPIIKDKTHLPIIVDPSHAVGRHKYVPAMSLAAIAAGADGLIIEVHPNPNEALSDGPQSLTPSDFSRLCKDISDLAKIVGRTF